MEELGYEYQGEASKHDHYKKTELLWRCTKSCCLWTVLLINILRRYGKERKRKMEKQKSNGISQRESFFEKCGLGEVIFRR